MASGDTLGTVDLGGARVRVVEHRDGGRALHITAGLGGVLSITIDVDGPQAARLAALLADQPPPDREAGR